MPSRLGCWSFSRLTGNESTAEVVVLHGRLLRAAVACPGIDVDRDAPRCPALGEHSVGRL